MLLASGCPMRPAATSITPIFSPHALSHWTWVLNIGVPAVFTLKLSAVGLFAGPDHPDVIAMSRSGRPRDLLFGPLFFTVVMCFTGTALFRDPRAAFIMGALGWGDGLAPVVGMAYGRHKYCLFGPSKSFEGSLTMFVASLCGICLFQYALPASTLTGLSLLTCAAVATAVEAASPPEMDNLLIPIAMFLAGGLF